ncbi:ArsC family reductase [Candidatus Fukatsuia symbiotica]|uniref:ArsC family reductase n=1 Tax=Candidatus Fukatsuia symbiotica TaxID=1878942 RepID=A0A2U8IAX5_9GAMM|nr:ArsC family reductase [Candidatus Fukatsuia symbiotica]
MRYRLYGIRNCATIQKARAWLDDHAIAYKFHDYRVDGLTAERLQDFIDTLGWESLLNTRGTTWRKLSEAERAVVIDASAAKALMLAQPALIKRPLLEEYSGRVLLGFDPASYQQFFSEAS